MVGLVDVDLCGLGPAIVFCRMSNADSDFDLAAVPERVFLLGLLLLALSLEESQLFPSPKAAELLSSEEDVAGSVLASAGGQGSPVTTKW